MVSSCFGCWLTLACALPADAPDSLNGRPLPAATEPAAYSFLAVGHVYGAPDTESAWPAASLVANVDRINAAGADLVFLLGDCVRSPDEQHFANLRQFAGRLTAPVLHAAGNHDVLGPGGRAGYERRFGKGYSQFRHRGDCFIVLDTELDEGRIGGGQLVWLTRQLDAAAADPAVRNIFLFSHRLLWAVDDPRLAVVWAHVNSQAGYQKGAFARDVDPLLTKAAAAKPVYWFSGDIGIARTLGVFCWKDPDRNVTFAAAGLGDTAADAILRVDVDAAGGVTIRTIPLGDPAAAEESAEAHGLAAWQEHFANEPAAPSPWSRIGGLLADKRWWLGFGTGAVLAVLAAMVIAQLRRRRTPLGPEAHA